MEYTMLKKKTECIILEATDTPYIPEKMVTKVRENIFFTRINFFFFVVAFCLKYPHEVNDTLTIYYLFVQ